MPILFSSKRMKHQPELMVPMEDGEEVFLTVFNSEFAIPWC
jgi:hypothetical protein